MAEGPSGNLAMLIRNSEVWRRGAADVRVRGGVIAELSGAGALVPEPGEPVIDAAGGALLPGLHDHHIHLAGLAAARRSVDCGPPAVRNAAELARVLHRPGADWLRGVGYHESVAGMLDRRMMDIWVPHRPVRIQHRSGRMWFLNSAAMDQLLEAAGTCPAGLDRVTGQLLDEDAWLRRALGSALPDLAEIGRELAALGITGVTEISATNGPPVAAHLARQQASGALPQQVLLAGGLELTGAAFTPRLRLGPLKLHLHDHALPDFDGLVGEVRAGRTQGRTAAFHCTTEAELVYALATIDAVGSFGGDRIEHAGIAPDHLVAEMRRLAVQVISQPHFIAERGDAYLADVDPADHPFLYRLAAIRAAGVVLAAGSDAPYGRTDPWFAMRAAISRRTASAQVIGPDEALTPEEALALYLADPADLAAERKVAAGEPADLCLLGRPWAAARERLEAADVRLTVIAGEPAQSFEPAGGGNPVGGLQ